MPRSDRPLVELIPPPRTVRSEISERLKELRLLRRMLRLSIAADEVQREQRESPRLREVSR